MMMAAALNESERVADELRAQIQSGALSDGERMPSLTEIAARYGVSTHVAQRAVAILRAQRLVTTRHGAGTYVSRFPLIVRPTPGRLARGRWAAGEAIQDADTGPRPRTVGTVVAEVPAPAFVAEALDIPTGTAVVSRSRRFLVEHRAVQLATSYLPLDVVRAAPAVTYTDSGLGGIYARMDEAGFGPVRFREDTIARAPYPDERTALELAATGALVFEIVRYAYTADRCVEVNRMILDASAYALRTDFDA